MANKLEVHCTINNCHYWKQGNHCDASQILVTNDSLGSRQPENVDAPMASSLGPTPAGGCVDTCCKTFVPRDSSKAGEDGVFRA